MKMENLNLIEKTHSYMDRITKSLDNFQYNVAVALIRELSNIFLSHQFNPKEKEDLIALKFSLTKWIIMISPMIPHLAEECWSMCGNKTTLSTEPWPDVDTKFLIQEKIKVVIQINGKRRADIETAIDTSEEEIMEEIKKIASVNDQIKGSTIIKKIFIPNKILNVVISKE